jgi:mRNA interferase HigB
LLPIWEGTKLSKMLVLNSSTLLNFGKEHAEAGPSLRELNRTLRAARWTKMQDVIEAYPSATVLNAERVVFKVKGNDYRAIVAFDFLRHAAFVKFVGSHAHCDRIDALKVSHFSGR